MRQCDRAPPLLVIMMIQVKDTETARPELFSGVVVFHCSQQLGRGFGLGMG